ncbi:MFS transporter [Nocardioides acrostichi]|uniref:MFS transporter n=1 Tax=Nocardioides acrostichi TaxID=2784339 RepID=A0A930Y9G3_9ACTN|nr:MFS transporter [Nocardioides acrostichi]MBF4160328.1 MFS transporter [Nocardioides acrostichi]
MRRSGWWFLIGLVLTAVNLRPGVVSIGPVLDEVQRGVGLSGPEAGLLTSLPVLCFACVGAAASWVAARLGLHRAMLLALVAVTAGLAGRALVGSAPSFLLLSGLALAGTALANVLLPSLVKRHAPDRVGAMTALYSTLLAVGLTLALVSTVPLGAALSPGDEGWRWGLGFWAAPALMGVAAWGVLARHDRPAVRARGSLPLGDVARTPLALGLAGFFGLQSVQAYVIFGWFATLWRDSGFSAATAGVLVGVVTGTSIPLSAWLPGVLARSRRPGLVLGAVCLCFPFAFTGLLVAPASLAVLWAVLAGIGTTSFPLVLTLIGLRADTAEGTASLSAFVQSTGYLIAAAGPFVVGVLHGASDGWSLPLVFLLALCVPLLVLVPYVVRPATIEEQVATRCATAGDATEDAASDTVGP